MADGDLYQHLGTPTGFRAAHSAEEAIAEMAQNVIKIDESLLAPWQKFDAVNTFILPCATFHMRNGRVPNTLLNSFDKVVKRCGKKWLNLPQRAGVEILYLSNQAGGMGLLPLNSAVNASQLAHGLYLLTSESSKSLARASLNTAVACRLQRPAEPREVATYLNGSNGGPFRSGSTDVSNMWARVRIATRKLRSNIKVTWIANGPYIQLMLNDSPLAPKGTEAAIKASIRETFRQRRLRKPDQGKVYAITSATTAPNHFMRCGNFTRFAEWRFIFRARLGCVPLNGARKFGNGDKRCRRCGFGNETLPHVLNHCVPHFTTMTRRHNAVLDRIVKALRPPEGAEVRVNQTVPGLQGNLRPDLVILEPTTKRVTIVDVTIPFENRYAAFEAARREKQQKYQTIVEYFQQQGFDTSLDAFVVGSLGGWDPANEITLQRIGIGRNYAKLMKRLMCTDVIRWSRDIYIEHITGHRQYQEGQ